MKFSALAFFLFSVAFLFFLPFGRAEPAKSIVVRNLLSKSVPIGHDVAKQRYVALGVAENDIPEGMELSHLLPIRDRLYAIALLRAKQCLLEEIAVVMSGEDRISDRFSADNLAETLDESAMKVWASGLYCGFLPLASAESLENGRYQVAIAVGWSKKSEMDARAALMGAGPFPENDVIPSPAWEAWASRKDFSFLCGAWPFVDSEGIRRFVGIGTADADGKKGKDFLTAMRLAKSKAEGALALALYGDIESSKMAGQIVARSQTSSGVSEKISTECFEDRIFQSVKDKRFMMAEVYTTTVVHPLSGRKLFVSVVGIEPKDLAEMRILGDDATLSSTSPAARPAHVIRPPSNRPDHSWRAPSNRPDHSPRHPSFRPQHPNGGNWSSLEDEMDF